MSGVRETGRCFQACFLDEQAKELTLEGKRAIADLVEFAKMGAGPKDHSFLRDLTGRIDPLSMARIEGRREAVNRVLRYLKLDPGAIRHLEVDDG